MSNLFENSKHQTYNTRKDILMQKKKTEVVRVNAKLCVKRKTHVYGDTIIVGRYRAMLTAVPVYLCGFMKAAADVSDRLLCTVLYGSCCEYSLTTQCHETFEILHAQKVPCTDEPDLRREG